jgi:hypothetical protein
LKILLKKSEIDVENNELSIYYKKEYYMCLKEITKTYDENDSTEGYGWKRVLKYEEFFRFPFFDSGTKQPYNKYINRIYRIITTNNYDIYNSGFHLFKTRAQARSAMYDGAVVKVKFRGIVCEGRQYYTSRQADCLVVKEIMIENGNVQNAEVLR